MYETVPVVAELNRVTGFDPLKFARRISQPGNPGARLQLDLKYKKLWFRLKYPQGRLKVKAVPWTGYARRFDSFKHYIDYSFEMLNPEIAASLFVKERPIYTLTHDTPPALYGSKANVSDSFVSNGCIVEGTVRHSIICRDVKVGKDAVVEDSIVFSNVSIGDKATVKNCVIDKYSIITARHAIEGDGKTPIYLKQGAIL